MNVKPKRYKLKTAIYPLQISLVNTKEIYVNKGLPLKQINMIKEINNPESVTKFIQEFPPDLANLIQNIRQLILSTSKEIGEEIKWNSPNFFYTGEMKLFNPKEYKRDIVVINVRKGFPLLIFPTGASINDTTGLLEGEYTDGRRLATFKSAEDVNTKGKLLQEVIKKWLKQVEK